MLSFSHHRTKNKVEKELRIWSFNFIVIVICVHGGQELTYTTASQFGTHPLFPFDLLYIRPTVNQKESQFSENRLSKKEKMMASPEREMTQAEKPSW